MRALRARTVGGGLRLRSRGGATSKTACRASGHRPPQCLGRARGGGGSRQRRPKTVCHARREVRSGVRALLLPRPMRGGCRETTCAWGYNLCAPRGVLGDALPRHTSLEAKLRCRLRLAGHFAKRTRSLLVSGASVPLRAPEQRGSCGVDKGHQCATLQFGSLTARRSHVSRCTRSVNDAGQLETVGARR